MNRIIDRRRQKLEILQILELSGLKGNKLDYSKTFVSLARPRKNTIIKYHLFVEKPQPKRGRPRKNTGVTK